MIARARTMRISRRGAVLLLVLVIIPVLALGGYAFTHWMRAEAQASLIAKQQEQASWLAESGIEMVRALLADPLNFEPGELDLEDNPGQFSAQEVFSDADGRVGLVTVVAATPVSDSGQVMYGLVDESAKIPLHNPNIVLTQDALMELPGMTESIADAIIDWFDDDDTQETLGAESQYYAQLDPPYRPRNAPPKSIDELLLIKGITPALLFGEDANLDGVLNDNENDGDESWPPDNADGVLDRGWLPYFTLHSASANLNSLGEPKINLNGDTQEVAEELSTLFGDELAQFYVAYRGQNSQIRAISDLIDAVVNPQQSNEEERNGENEESAPSSAGGNSDGGNQAASASSQRQDAPANRGRGGNAESQASQQQGGQSGGGGSGGDSQSEARREAEPIRSPWRSENVGEYLAVALDQLSVTDEPIVRGRIDVMRAPYEVLRLLPDFDDALANTISTAAQNRPADEATPAWLLVDGHLELEEFRRIESLVTTTLQNRVFRFQSVGFYAGAGPIARIEVIIDASAEIPNVVYRRDLTRAGGVYPRETLIP